MKSIILKVDQRTIVPFIYAIVILIGIDLITTFIGIRFGFDEEKNIIPIMFMQRYGDFNGLLISYFGKIMLVLFPLLAYKTVHGYIEKESNKLFNDIPLKNIYFILYMTIIIMSMVTTFVADMNNMMLILKGIYNYG